MRRVGKSYFLMQIQDYLHTTKKIAKKRMLCIEKESLEFEFIKNYEDLYHYVSKQFNNKSQQYYLFIDEVQEIEEWEKAITSFFKAGNIQIFITGSNAHLLSSELATYLSGRYVEVPIYPLSFKEFTEFGAHKGNTDELFKLYLKFGGLPGIQNLTAFENETFQYIQSIYHNILFKDIIQRFNIRSATSLERVSRFILDNIGNLFSAKKISDYLKQQKLSTSVETVQNYCKYLSDAYLIHKAQRWDIKGKRILEMSEKYYLNDLGLRHAILSYKEMDIADLLENIVYMELLKRGYQVYVGKTSKQEIDFVASRSNQVLYVQVSYMLSSQKTMDRELSAFGDTEQNNKKLLITMDPLHANTSCNNVTIIHLYDFLLK